MERMARKSKSNTTDLVNEHELMGVTSDMLDWWWDNIDNTERYKLWHPKAHKSFVWENPSLDGHIGKIQRVYENIKIPTLLRIRWERVKDIPISPSYSHILAASILDRNDKPISWLLHEYEPIQNGVRLRSTFRLPAKVPRWFIKALRKHDMEEMSELPNFLPKLFEENNK
jgi:hypothetical protein